MMFHPVKSGLLTQVPDFALKCNGLFWRSLAYFGQYPEFGMLSILPAAACF